MDLSDFNADEVEPQGDFEAMPPGIYLAMITDSDERRTKAGDGSYLALTFEVLEGQYKGRKIWANLNVNNPSERAVQIARGQLSAICRAVGVKKPGTSFDLHCLPLAVKVKVREWEGVKRNETAAFYPAEKAAKEEDDLGWGG